MTTTARREGTDWVINGAKRWIGNATWGHRAIVWAKEQGGDGRFLGFIVPTDTPGWSGREDRGKVQPAHRAERPHHPHRRPRPGHGPAAGGQLLPSRSPRC